MENKHETRIGCRFGIQTIGIAIALVASFGRGGRRRDEKTALLPHSVPVPASRLCFPELTVASHAGSYCFLFLALFFFLIFSSLIVTLPSDSEPVSLAIVFLTLVPSR